tara:strand:+ start:321 stop:500 length:180 start_codon:yes stop_codon:yes gene_type:complete
MPLALKVIPDLGELIHNTVEVAAIPQATILLVVQPRDMGQVVKVGPGFLTRVEQVLPDS